MHALKRKIPVVLCTIAASAGLILGSTTMASATAGSTYTPFKLACWAGSPGNIAQAQTTGVTVNHTTVASPGTNTYTVAFDSQTVPGASGIYTVTSLTNMQYDLQYNPATMGTYSIPTTGAGTGTGTGTGYTGTPSIVATTSTNSGTPVLRMTIPSVAPGSFTPPTITLNTSSSTFDVKLNTSSLRESEFGYFSGNFYRFTSNGTAFGAIPYSANTSCIPSDTLPSSAGSSPTLNAGAGVLHP